MPKYYVSIPIAGSLCLEVEAEDEDGAKAAMWDKIHNHDGADWSEVGELEWEFYERLTSGNVSHVSQNEIDIQEAD